MLPFKPLFDMYLYVKSGRIKHGSEDSVHKDSFNTPFQHSGFIPIYRGTPFIMVAQTIFFSEWIIFG